MHTISSTPRPQRTPWHYAQWIPLVVVLALAMGSPLGLFSSLAGAASDSGSVQINGDVDKDVQLDGSACNAADLTLPSLTAGDPMVPTPSDCAITYSTNNSTAGASLTVQEDPAGGAGDAMKCIAGGCAGDSLTDYAGADYTVQTGSNFGAALTSVSGAAAALWSLSPQTYAVAGGISACTTAGTTAAGTCSFRFAASADPIADQPGAYQALVQFTAQAI